MLRQVKLQNILSSNGCVPTANIYLRCKIILSHLHFFALCHFADLHLSNRAPWRKVEDNRLACWFIWLNYREEWKAEFRQIIFSALTFSRLPDIKMSSNNDEFFHRWAPSSLTSQPFFQDPVTASITNNWRIIPLTKIIMFCR